MHYSAFSSDLDTGSRRENASNQKSGVSALPKLPGLISGRKRQLREGVGPQVCWRPSCMVRLFAKLEKGRMLFNSYLFIFVFLPVALAGYFALGRSSNLAPVVWLTL